MACEASQAVSGGESELIARLPTYLSALLRCTARLLRLATHWHRTVGSPQRCSYLTPGNEDPALQRMEPVPVGAHDAKFTSPSCSPTHPPTPHPTYTYTYTHPPGTRRPSHC